MWLSKTAYLLEQVANPVSRVINNAGITIIMVMMFLTATDVSLRYLFNRPIKGALEVTEYMLVILVFLGIAYTAVKKGHINVEVLVSRVPQRAREIIDSITCLIGLVLFCLLTWQSAVQAGIVQSRDAYSAVLRVPVHPFVLVVAFGSAVLCLVLLVDLINSLVRVIKRSRWGILIWLLVGGVLATSPLWVAWLPWEISPLTVGFIGFGILLLLLFSGMPIGFVMASVGILGMAYLSGTEVGIALLRRIPYDTASSYTLTVLPLFVLMGAFCFHSGLSRDLYYTAYRWLGYLPGGLAMATIGASAGFAAVTGSSLASAATMGTVALPEMKRYNYDPALATGSVAAGGTLGILIPPSVILIIYGLLAEQSIGRLFIAGIFPGLLLAALFMTAIYILTKRNIKLGPPGPRTSFIEKVVSLKGTWAVLVLFVVVMGGIYLGIFTPTEAAGVGAFGAFLFALGKRQLSRQKLIDSLIDAGKTTAFCFIIVIGATIFGTFLAVTRLPFELASLIAGLPLSPYIIFGIIIVIYLFLGCIVDALTMVILTVPIFFPLVLALGFDPIWFGVMIVLVAEMGLITPPVGINVFIIKGVAPDVPMYTIFRGILPFLFCMLVCVVILVAFPQIALFLPTMMKG